MLCQVAHFPLTMRLDCFTLSPAFSIRRTNLEQVTRKPCMLAKDLPDHSMKMIPPKFDTGCLSRMSLQKTGASHVDDAAPTSAEAIQKYFADEIIPFSFMRRHHICAHRCPRPKAAGDIIKFASTMALGQSSGNL